MVIGYLISLALGMVSFEPVQNAKNRSANYPVSFWTGFSTGTYLYAGGSLLLMLFKPSVNLQQQRLAMDRDATDEELSGGIMGSGFTNFIGSLFGSIPVATFGQNVGLVTVTKVINKYVLVFASVILLIRGFVPKVVIINYDSLCGIGGATISVFASISMTGIRMIASQK